MAFDDRELDIAPDGSFEFRYTAEPGAKTMIVREVFNDWDSEERGTLTIERPDTLGQPAKELTRDLLAKKYDVAARSLVGSIQTWFAFPHFFQYKEPVNTLTAPQSTPGGLASQRSSIGHYELAEDQALVITVPALRRLLLPGRPGRLGLVRVDRLRDAPDLAHQGPGGHRPRRSDAVRRVRTGSAPGRHRQLAGDHRAPNRRADAALAAARARSDRSRTVRPSSSARSTRWATHLPATPYHSPRRSTPPGSRPGSARWRAG